MNDINYNFSPRLKKLVDIGESPLNIIHGELKNLMLEAEDRYKQGESQYDEGQLDAYSLVYQLTYDLYFALADRENNEGY
jgi:hypothetical protein